MRLFRFGCFVGCLLVILLVLLVLLVVGRFVNCFVGCFIGCFVGCFIGHFAGCFVGCCVGCFVSHLDGRFGFIVICEGQPQGHRKGDAQGHRIRTLLAPKRAATHTVHLSSLGATHTSMPPLPQLTQEHS